MRLYRVDFFDLNDAAFATHEIAYCCDKAAIRGGHAINGSPTIGAGFRIWRDGHVVFEQHNVLPEPGCPTRPRLLK